MGENGKEKNSKDGHSCKTAKTTVLVAEDDPINLKMIAAMLVDEGYAVHAVEDGQQCVESAAGLLPDLILMDIGMPNLDGIQACIRLKASDKLNLIPVIFVTASTDDHTLQAAFDAGASDYVRKPVSRIELLARVNTALAQRRAFTQWTEEQTLKGVLETAGGICHELNQPLQYVLGALQLLMMDISEENDMYNRVRTIVGRVEQMGEITRKLTEITRYRTRKYVGARDIIDLDQSISSTDEDV